MRTLGVMAMSTIVTIKAEDLVNEYEQEARTFADAAVEAGEIASGQAFDHLLLPNFNHGPSCPYCRRVFYGGR